MLATTLDVIKAGLKSDPTVSPSERARLLTLLRHGPSTPKAEPLPSNGPRLVTRRNTAAMLAKSVRTIDKLAATGVLKRRLLPGRKRSAGFLESDILVLLNR
jgi:hypothetical protein